MEIEICVLTPLDTPAKRRAFEAFVPIYEDAFPVLDEREDHGLWRERILAYANGHVRDTITTVIVAGHHLEDADRLTVVGGIVIEVFPESQTGLVSYVAVAPDVQGKGVARKLVEAAHEAFLAVAAAEQERRGEPFEIRAVFAEAEDPRRYADPEEKAVVRHRLKLLGRLGARWIDVPYLQPPLADDCSAIDLLLLAVPLPGHSSNRIETKVVRAFLAEYYGIPSDAAAPPDEDRPAGSEEEWEKVKERWEKIKVRLAELELEAEAGFAVIGTLEDPLLSLPRVAIALHTVTVEVEVPLADGETEIPTLEDRHATAREAAQAALGRTDLWSGLLDDRPKVSDSPIVGDGRKDVPATLLKKGQHPEESCPIFNSFEIDILNYLGIQDRPVVSVCYTDQPIDVEIHVPDPTSFHTEGRKETWLRPRTPIPARLALSYSRFRHSNVRVWHVVFRPRSADAGGTYDGTFTELDLVRLITLYDGSQEQSNVPPDLRLSLPGSPPVHISDFLFERTEGSLVGASFVAGTVEIELDDDPDDDDHDQADSPVDWATLFDAASRAGTSELDDELLKYEGPGSAHERIVAASGIVQGIFDYGRLAASELTEVFRPVIRSSKTEWKSINCATLLDVSVGENFLDVTEDTFGISPYLVIPHAVALHNEFVARAAEAQTDVAAKEGRGIASLSRAAGAAERLLRRLIVPNVFLYPSERELLDRVTAHRGAATLREVALGKLEELGGRLEREKVLSAGRRTHWLSAFLALLSLVAVLDAIEFADRYRGGKLAPGLVLALLLVAVLVLGGLYANARPRS